MKPEIAQLWTAALRSGHYTQAKGALRKEDSHCCLGVLCDLHRQATGQGEWVPVIDEYDNTVTEIQYRPGEPIFDLDGEEIRETAVLPEPVREWAGMSSCNGTLPGNAPTLWHLNDGTAPTLWHLNDGPAHTFARIADVIEQNVEVL